MTKQAVYLSLITVFLWAMYNNIARIVASHGIHPIAFVVVSFVFTAVPLLLVAAPGERGLRTIKHGGVWLYSLFSLLEHMTTVFMFIYVSGTEGSLMQRMNAVIALAIAYVLFGQRPRPSDIYYVPFILIGFYLLVHNLPSENLGITLFLLALVVAFQLIKTFVAEKLSPFNDNDTIRTRLRITAIVSFVVSVMFMCVLFPLAFIKSGVTESHAAYDVLKLFPSFSDFFNWSTIKAALFFAVFNEAPSLFFYLWAVRVAGTTNFFAFAALVPFATFCIEIALVQFGVVEFKTLNMTVIAAGLLITIGALVKVIMGERTDSEADAPNVNMTKGAEEGWLYFFDKHVMTKEDEAHSLHLQKEYERLDKEHNARTQAELDARDSKNKKALENLQSYKKNSDS